LIWIPVILLAVAVSVDSLTIGVTYGMNFIAIPPLSKAVLSLVSGLSVLVSMAVGWVFEQRIHSSLATLLGGLVFVLLGLYQLWRNYRPPASRMLIDWRIPVLGLIIKVWREPLLADSDQSQTISGEEAFVLGGALALDAIAAGFGAAILGLPIWLTTLAVMAGSYLFITLGLKAGVVLVLMSAPRLRRDLRWLPGVLVISIGLLKIVFG
jgi:putative sporulation protein YtaF